MNLRPGMILHHVNGWYVVVHKHRMTYHDASGEQVSVYYGWVKKPHRYYAKFDPSTAPENVKLLAVRAALTQ